MSINSFLYFVKRLPILKKVIPDKVYGLIYAKNVFAVVGFVLMILRRFVTSFIAAIMCMTGAAMFAPEDATIYPEYPIVFVVFCCIWAPIIRPKCYNAEAGLYNAVRVMRMDARLNSLCFIFLDTALTAVSYVPAMLIMALITGTNIVVILPVVWYACRILVYAIDLLTVDLPKATRNAIGIAAMLLTSALGVTAIVKSIDVTFIYISLCIAAAICVLPIIKFSRFNELVTTYCTSEALLNQKEASKKGNRRMFELKKDVTASIPTGSMSPAKYLTYVFYKRHSALIWRRPLIAAGVAVVMFVAVFVAYVLGDADVYRSAAEGMSTAYKVLPFALYFMSSGENSTKAMFYNCDNAMLRMPFYREPKLLLKVFASRLVMLTIINALPALLVGLMISAINIIGGGEMINTVLMPVVTLLLSTFFAVHHLAMYYCLQPYTTDINVKNPFYTVIHAVVYLVCFGLYNADMVIDGFVYILASATAIYIIAALILVYKKAPKNFRIK